MTQAPIPMHAHIMSAFAFGHMHPHLWPVAKSYSEIAETLLASLPAGLPRTVAIRSLLEARDAALRAFIHSPSSRFQPPSTGEFSMANQTGVAIVIKAFLPIGKTIDEQFAALGLVKTAHETGDYASLLKAATVEEVKTEQKTRRVEDQKPAESGGEGAPTGDQSGGAAPQEQKPAEEGPSDDGGQPQASAGDPEPAESAPAPDWASEPADEAGGEAPAQATQPSGRRRRA